MTSKWSHSNLLSKNCGGWLRPDSTVSVANAEPHRGQIQICHPWMVVVPGSNDWAFISMTLLSVEWSYRYLPRYLSSTSSYNFKLLMEMVPAWCRIEVCMVVFLWSRLREGMPTAPAFCITSLQLWFSSTHDFSLPKMIYGGWRKLDCQQHNPIILYA